MKANRTFLLTLIVAVITILLLLACSSSDDSSDSSSSPPDVSGGHTFVLLKDDLWFTVKGDGFLAKNGAGVSQFWGTVTSMSNLFSKLTITYSNVSNPKKDTVHFALPVNDALMLLFPKDGAVSVNPATYRHASVALATGGSCPSAAVDFLAVLGPDSSHSRDSTADDKTPMTYGRAQKDGSTPFKVEGSLVNMTSDYTAPPGTSVLQPSFTGFTCSGFQASNTPGDKMFFTPSGMALAMTADTNNTHVLLPANTAVTQASDIVKSGIKFRGWSEIVTYANGEYENHIYPMALSGDGTDLDGGTYSDFEGNAFSGITITITASAGVPSGIFDTSILTYGIKTGNLRIVAAKMADGRIALVGVADSDNDDDGNYNADRDWTYIVLAEIP